MEKYKPGTVFDLYKDDNQEYMIVNNVEKENRVYLLVAPIYKENEEIKTDYTKVMLLNVDKDTDNIEIETDENIIREVINEIMKKIEE